MYKLIALDMDGTLLKNDKTISKETYKAIQTAKSKGVKVVLATGRPLKGIQRYLQDLDLIHDEDFAVAFNGAVVQNTKTKEVIAENILDVQDAKYLYNISKSLKVNVHALTPTSCITPKWNKYSQIECDMNHIPMELINFENLEDTTTVIKVMFVDAPESLSEVIKNLPSEVYEKYTVVQSSPYFLEFLNKKVNKGVGVELLAKTLGISQDEVICIGDADNDIHMIEYAGLGVAMGNAFPEVKKAADYITHTNEEDGVAHVINKFILAS